MELSFVRTTAILLSILLVPVTSFHYVKAEERMNPLRFGEDQKSWQITLNLSRSVTTYRDYITNSRGLWEVENNNLKTLYKVESSFDLNKRIGFRGSFSFYSSSVDSEKVNLWTGTREKTEVANSDFKNVSFKIKYIIWENSELRTYFLIPVLGDSVATGLTWSRDPMMVFPTITLTDSGVSIATRMSFVANKKMALTGGIGLTTGKENSRLGFSGGFVYREGQYDGIRVSASLTRGDVTSVTLGAGLSYGEEKQ